MAVAALRPARHATASWLSHRWAIPAILVLCLVSRIAVAVAWPQQPFSDGAFYLERAAELATGRGYMEAGHATAFWPVGHPLLLAGADRLFGPGMTGAVALNVLASLATLALMMWFGSYVLKAPLAGRAAALLYAVYPAHIVYVGTSLSEPAAAAAGMAGLSALVAARGRWAWLLGAGLMFGLATLMRTQMLLFPIGALIGVVWVQRCGWRTGARAALPLALGMAVIVAPWSLRNLAELGTPALSTNGGIALITGANDRATGDHMLLDPAELDRARKVPAAERISRQVEVDGNLRAAAVRWIADHPGEWLALGVRKVAILWSKDTDAFWSLQASYPRAAPAIAAGQAVNQLFYLLLLALAVPALWTGARALLTGRSEGRQLALLLLMPAFVSLTAFVFTGQTRYHHPAMPFVALAAGWTLARWIQRPSGAGRLPRLRPAPT